MPACPAVSEFVEPGIAGRAGLPEDQQTPAALWDLGNVVVQQANTLAYRDCFLSAAVVFAVALGPTWLLDRGRRAPR